MEVFEQCTNEAVKSGLKGCSSWRFGKCVEEKNSLGWVQCLIDDHNVTAKQRAMQLTKREKRYWKRSGRYGAEEALYGGNENRKVKV